MVLTIIISIITILALIISVIKFPEIKIKKIKLQTFWVVSLIGAILIVVTNRLSIKEYIEYSNNEIVNPYKILVLFICVSLLSIVLDELNFFKWLAIKTANKFKSNQMMFFISLYFLVAILTVFTSNDIIILTFTPFICMYAKNTKINPIPYLIAEFVAANTWSMMLMISNPTNIFLSLTYNINFIDYLKVMFIPCMVGGITSLIILLLIFKKELKKPIEIISNEEVIMNRPLVIFSLANLIICTILIAISNFINLEMWLISAISALLSLVVLLITNKGIFLKSVKRIPFNLIPFVLSMFLIVLALYKYNVTFNVASMLDRLVTNKFSAIFVYGYFSIILDNLINNIPMSLFAIKLLQDAPLYSVYAVIIGSNLGAYLTPIGALAGIMWMNILKKENVNINFKSFIKYGIILVPIISLVSFGVLFLVM